MKCLDSRKIKCPSLLRVCHIPSHSASCLSPLKMRQPFGRVGSSGTRRLMSCLSRRCRSRALQALSLNTLSEICEWLFGQCSSRWVPMGKGHPAIYVSKGYWAMNVIVGSTQRGAPTEVCVIPVMGFLKRNPEYISRNSLTLVYVSVRTSSLPSIMCDSANLPFRLDL